MHNSSSRMFVACLRHHSLISPTGESCSYDAVRASRRLYPLCISYLNHHFFPLLQTLTSRDLTNRPAPLAAATMDSTSSQLSKMSLFNVSNNEPFAPPISNFPLPKPLREKIFSYLLLGDFVRDEPFHTRPMSQRSKVRDILD